VNCTPLTAVKQCYQQAQTVALCCQQLCCEAKVEQKVVVIWKNALDLQSGGPDPRLEVTLGGWKGTIGFLGFLLVFNCNYMPMTHHLVTIHEPTMSWYGLWQYVLLAVENEAHKPTQHLLWKGNASPKISTVKIVFGANMPTCPPPNLRTKFLSM